MELVTRRLRADMTWGMGYGLSMATLFSVWVLLVTAGHGNDVQGKYGLSPGRIVGVYFVCGALAGALVGFFRPATQYRFGAFVVGAAAGILVYGAAALAMTGGLRKADFVIAAILGTLVGGAIADSQFHDHRKGQGD
jgi:hypothetical protein